MKNFFFIALVAVAFCGCQNPQSSNASQGLSNQESGEQVQTQKSREQESWTYSKDVDDLSGEVVGVSAILRSTNEIEYELGKTTRLAIDITYGSGTGHLQNTVLIAFYGDEYKLCRMSDFQGSGFLATFDDGPIDDTWSLVFLGSDRRGLTIYKLDQVADFISKIKQSKKCRIQVNTEQVGKKTFEFNTKGLDWNFK